MLSLLDVLLMVIVGGGVAFKFIKTRFCGELSGSQLLELEFEDELVLEEEV